jgi:hypothetical protein
MDIGFPTWRFLGMSACDAPTVRSRRRHRRQGVGDDRGQAESCCEEENVQRPTFNAQRRTQKLNAERWTLAVKGATCEVRSKKIVTKAVRLKRWASRPAISLKSNSASGHVERSRDISHSPNSKRFLDFVRNDNGGSALDAHVARWPGCGK